ncbi:phage tail tape measure protein [Bacillus sp. CGMCC 1.16607]|uniref:phage tail tape measure protein n=1 Tax=Bacillus sp. CGMCC 1.16607 TaxID=3351842 RepID=UPI003629DD5E
MAEIGSLAVSLSLDASNFNGSIAQVDRSLKAMGGELQSIKAKGADYGKSIEGLGQKQDVLTRSLDTAGLKLQEQRKRYDELVVSGTASQTSIERQAIAVNKAQTEYNRLETELKEVTEQLKVQSSQWTHAGQKLQDVGGKMKSIGTGMTSVGKDLTMKVTAPILAMGAGVFKAAVDFESAFAGVRKTVNTSEAGFKKLELGIRDMSKQLPASASDIAAVAESAGQLGIAENKILSFSKTIIDLGESTNLTREQAASEFARFANIVGMSQDNFDRLGSSIVGLGNTMATTESEIMSMAMRLAAQGAQVGMSEAQILALSATMSSLGIEAEAGGTAMTTALKKMQNAVSKGGKDLGAFASAAKMSASEFKKAYESDATSALDALIKGLAGSAKDGKNLNVILEKLGITGIREADTILRLAGASDLLTSAVDTSTKAWHENTALSNEATQRYKTTASQMSMLKNQVVDVGISLGQTLIPMASSAMDKIGSLVDKFNNLTDGQKKAILTIGGVAAAIGPLLVIGGTLISSIGSIVTVVGAASTAIGAAGGAAALLGSTLAVLTGPIGLTVAGLALLGVAAYKVSQDLKKPSMEIDVFGENVSKSTEKAVGGFLKLNDKATLALNQLNMSGTAVTKTTADNIVKNFEQMGDQMLESLKKKHDQELETMNQFFENSKLLNEKDKQDTIAKMNEKYEQQTNAVNNGEKIIKDILTTASNEKRSLTKEEQIQINNIQEGMVNNGIKYLSKNEIESKSILERMKAQAGEISAKQAADVVKNSQKQTEGAIKAANEQYDKTVQEIIRQRDEIGSITAEQAKIMILDAKMQRDQVVGHAKDLHKNVVEEAKQQAGEHADHVNWEKGEVLSKWEMMKKDTSKKAAEIKNTVSEKWEEIKNDTSEKWDEIKGWTGKKIEEMKTNVETKMAEVKTKIETKWNEAQAFLSSISLKQIGKDIVLGLIGGIGDMFNGVQKKVEELAGLIPDWAKKKLGIKSPSRVMMAVGRDTVQGLAIGINNNTNIVKRAADDMVRAAIPDFSQAVSVTKTQIKTIQSIISKSSKENAAEIVKVEKDRDLERLQITKDAHTKIEKIETDASEKIQKIRDTAASKKKKLTIAQLNEIKKINSDTAQRIREIEVKAGEDRVKASKKAGESIAKIETSVAADKLKALKEYAEAHKQAGDMSLKQEAEFWKYSANTFQKGTTQHTEALKLYNRAVENLNAEMLTNIKNYISEKKSLGEMTLIDEVRVWKENLDIFKEGSKERIEAQKAYNSAIDAVNKEIVSINKDYQSQMQTINDELIKQENDLTNAYEDALSKRQSTLMSFAGLFDAFSVEVKASGIELLGNLQSQVDGFKLWQDEFAKLSSRDIDANLLSELSGLGVKALPELIALNQLTDEQLTLYSSLYQEKSALAREQAEAELIGMKEDTEKQIDLLRASAETKLGQLQIEWQAKIKELTQTTSTELSTLQQIGADAGAGLLNGLSSMEGPLIAKATAIANSIKAAIQSALDIHSPSRVMRGFGVNIGQGLVQGMDDMVTKVTAASQRLAKSVEGGVATSTLSSNSYDYSKQFSPNVTIHTTDNGAKEMERTLRRMAFSF